MILGDKIARLRKKNGWSQEELAERTGVSRQAVSKWEGAQTVPDLDKILLLGELFGVTTDYLLKDELEMEEFTESTGVPVRRVTLEEAAAFLAWRRSASVRIALGTFLCVIAVIPLLLLGAAADSGAVREETAAFAGLASLLVLVAIAAAVFLLCGFRNEPYAFLDRGDFETEYGVAGLAREWRKAYRRSYVACNVAGTCLCVLSPVSLFLGMFAEDAVTMTASLSVTLALAGTGAALFILAGVREASVRKLLREGEFSPRGRREERLKEAVSTAYWLLATAVYLGWSFLTNNWRDTWLVWAVAGVLFPAVLSLCGLFVRREE